MKLKFTIFLVVSREEGGILVLITFLIPTPTYLPIQKGSNEKVFLIMIYKCEHLLTNFYVKRGEKRESFPKTSPKNFYFWQVATI